MPRLPSRDRPDSLHVEVRGPSADCQYEDDEVCDAFVDQLVLLAGVDSDAGARLQLDRVCVDPDVSSAGHALKDLPHIGVGMSVGALAGFQSCLGELHNMRYGAVAEEYSLADLWVVGNGFVWKVTQDYMFHVLLASLS